MRKFYEVDGMESRKGGSFIKTRDAIKLQIKSEEAKIKESYEKIKNLRRENALLSDDKQWFTEGIETVGKLRVKKLLGKINWVDNFVDADSGDVIKIDRSMVVRIDGKWINEYE